MSLVRRLRGELVDVVEWTDASRDTVVRRFARHNNEIKMGARLTVREGQAAVFVNEGLVADVFGPGMHTLETENLPVLSTLRGWRHGFRSPFQAEVYFVSTRLFPDQRWGTQNPALMRDAEFGMVRVRAFGAYAFRVVDPELLLKELVGTDPHFRTDEVTDFIRQHVVSRVTSALATSGVPVLDMAAHQGQVADRLAGVLSEDLAGLGLEMPRFVIENVSLPPEVETALDQRTKLGVLGDLDRYTRLQAADAVALAAQQPGGAAAAGVGLGLGAGMGAQLAAALGPQPAGPPGTPLAPAAPPTQPSPAPLPAAAWFVGIDGQQVGPLTAAELRARTAAGTVSGETLVWRDGMSAWTSLGQVHELAAAAPPPLPAP
jgi:membrane protease subunit (stomatin/prohibitin family)